jgi:hypothetical protein
MDPFDSGSAAYAASSSENLEELLRAAEEQHSEGVLELSGVLPGSASAGELAAWLEAQLGGYVWECAPPVVESDLPSVVRVRLNRPPAAVAFSTTDDEWLLLHSVSEAHKHVPVLNGSVWFIQHSDDGNILAAELSDDLPEWMLGKEAVDDLRLCLCNSRVHLVPPTIVDRDVTVHSLARAVWDERAGASEPLSEQAARVLGERAAQAWEHQHRGVAVVPEYALRMLSSGGRVRDAVNRFLSADSLELRHARKHSGGDASLCIVKFVLPRAMYAALAVAPWKLPRAWDGLRAKCEAISKDCVGALELGGKITLGAALVGGSDSSAFAVPLDGEAFAKAFGEADSDAFLDDAASLLRGQMPTEGCPPPPGLGAVLEQVPAFVERQGGLDTVATDSPPTEEVSIRRAVVDQLEAFLHDGGDLPDAPVRDLHSTDLLWPVGVEHRRGVECDELHEQEIEASATLRETFERLGGVVSEDLTLVDSFAKSVASQHGKAGPVSSLLGQLGVPVPMEWTAGAADDSVS